MIEIGLNEIKKNFGFKQVLSGASLEIMTGDRVAIVGRNGTGKTTLFKIITGEETPEQGTVSIRRGATVGYLEQIPKLPDYDTTARQVLRDTFARGFAVEAQMRVLEEEMALQTDMDLLDEQMGRYAGLQGEYDALDGYSMEENLAKVSNGFGLEPILDRPYRVLSGGQKTVVGLACTILKKPDILLLDEPTNHLDVRTLEWFEEYLRKYSGTVVIISHDRYFLDRVATRTIVLEAGSCTMFHGNYSFSLQEQERLLLLEFEQYKNQQKKIAAMEAAIKRFRDWGAQADNPKFFKKAKELELRLEKMERIDRPQLEKPQIPLKFEGGRTGKEVLKIEELSLRLGEAELFEEASATVYEKEKVCLMGDNGTGKTSLVRAVLGDVVWQKGKITLNPSVKLGYIPQEIRFENPKETVLEAFRNQVVCSEGQARNILAKYFFYGESVFKRAASLSGGEKVLLKLAVLLQNQVNFLVLDEPTNHIDIETREMLEEALLEYKGTLLFVSHDRYFINKIAGRIAWIWEKRIESFYGTYDEYRKYAGR